MRKFFVGIVMAAVATIGFGSVAFASSTPTQASCDGQIHGAFADVNGNFGFLGTLDRTFVIGSGTIERPGASPQTGDNNADAAAFCQSL